MNNGCYISIIASQHPRGNRVTQRGCQPEWGHVGDYMGDHIAKASIKSVLDYCQQPTTADYCSAAPITHHDRSLEKYTNRSTLLWGWSYTPIKSKSILLCHSIRQTLEQPSRSSNPRNWSLPDLSQTLGETVQNSTDIQSKIRIWILQLISRNSLHPSSQLYPHGGSYLM